MPPFQKTLEGDIIVDTNHRGHASPWTPEQSTALASSMSPWVKFAFVENGKLDGRHPKLTKWKQEEADRILKLPQFQTLPEGMSPAKARESIVRKFTNYRNRHLKLDAPSNATAQQEIESRKIAAAALVDWKTMSSGRALFKRRNYSNIVIRRDQLLKEDPNLCQIGAFQKASKELWKVANQEWYEQESSEESDLSVFENQKLFPDYLWESMTGLCQSGSLGNTLMLTLYAFRDEQGIVASGAVETHHERGVHAFRKYASEAFPSLRRTFEEWANVTLPQTKPPAAIAKTDFSMPAADDGLPVFPTFNLDQVTTDVLRQLLLAYFHNVWAFCRPDEQTVPWEDIEASPAKYYDTSIHSFKLSLPTNLGTPATHALAEDLTNISSVNATTPFRFRPPSETAGETPVLPNSATAENLYRFDAAAARPPSPTFTNGGDPLPSLGTSSKDQITSHSTPSHDVSRSTPSNACSPRSRHPRAAGIRVSSPSSASQFASMDQSSFHHSASPSTQVSPSIPSQPETPSVHVDAQSPSADLSRPSQLSVTTLASNSGDQGSSEAERPFTTPDSSLKLLADTSSAAIKLPDAKGGMVSQEDGSRDGSGLNRTRAGSTEGEDGACGSGGGDIQVTFETGITDGVACSGDAMDAMGHGDVDGVAVDADGGVIVYFGHVGGRSHVITLVGLRPNFE